MAAPASDAPLLGFDEPICPYTGLRTFTEEEAIYFRGREPHVAKCLALLAAQRFVLVTGASGDGKSSLVFAGLLPEVRAGFVRARYSSWVVATFRPERSPLRNLATALATALRLEASATAVETELEQGFSALVQLYQASTLCPPAELPAGLPPAEQRRQQRQAANLLVVVDQFEEFFTNPENYGPAGPNAAAQTVVNLLLETTRLARARELPIYIVCTMRSDFVGQCAEFRGLMEQIGASQYFVPRLLRHEFVEVIREPALLSGNRISERLVQRLLYDIRYGQDQLPVLQHALRRMWLAADQGREELDLLHYAMVGGLSGELPAAEQARFAAWLTTAPQREFLLADSSLRNVLDAHANQLYFSAHDLYNQTFTPPLPPGVAERVIEQTFRVLTRTDGQRVVRNRLTGAEITAIISDETLSWPVICRILRPFRQAGTTFLSPFLAEDEDEHAVPPPEVVLDITHESLIRNWGRLTEWAQREAEDMRVAADFKQQAERWQANEEKAGFLLPIGPYTYFSQWYRRKRNPASWLAHYVDSSTDPSQRQPLGAAQHTLLTRFLAASRRRLRVPLLVAHYGLGRLAAVLLLPLLLAGLGWWAWNQRKQQADYVAYSILRDWAPTLRSPYVALEDKAHLLINANRLQPLVYTPWLGGHDSTSYAFPHLLDELRNDTLALNIELAIYQQITNAQYDAPEREHPWTRRTLLDLDRRLLRAGSLVAPVGGQPPSARQRELAVYTARTIMALAHYLTYAQLRAARQPIPAAQQAADQALGARKQALLRRLLAYAQGEVGATAGATPSPVEFGFCLRVLLGQGAFGLAELRFFDAMSPLGPAAARRQFKRLFPRQLFFYSRGGSLAQSGGYLTSALVFAAQRRPAQVRQCLDSLSQQATQLDDANGGLALVPYLVKYGLLTPGTVHDLLRRCGKVGNFPFAELYAATTYSLLSISPSHEVFAVSPSYQATTTQKATSASRSGSINPELLDLDRVSFSLPDSVRAKAWAALGAATPELAASEPLFVDEQTPTAAHYARNKALLDAFQAKMHGTYLAEIAHRPQAAAQCFATFDAARDDLKRLRQPGQFINTFHWNLGTAQLTEITQAGSVAQDPVGYLQQPTRPKTIFLQSYFTCAFNAFFLHQLRRATTQPGDARLVQLLDSVAFEEAAFPDRHANTRVNSLLIASLGRYRRSQPNLLWLRAVAEAPAGPGTDPGRVQRNALLYKVSAALQDSARLRRFQLSSAERDLLRHLSQQPGFAQMPMQLACSDLAAALAHARRGRQALALAALLPAPMPTVTAIRVGEQAMLLNDRSQQAALDSFLTAYQIETGAHPLKVADSVLPLLYWQAAETGAPGERFRSLATFLIQEGRSATQEQGPVAMCRGRSLADNSYQALRDIPAYQARRLRQSCFTAILAGLAHLQTNRSGDGWREYDDLVLLTPADYTGPLN